MGRNYVFFQTNNASLHSIKATKTCFPDNKNFILDLLAINLPRNGIPYVIMQNMYSKIFKMFSYNPKEGFDVYYLWGLDCFITLTISKPYKLCATMLHSNIKHNESTTLMKLQLLLCQWNDPYYHFALCYITKSWKLKLIGKMWLWNCDYIKVKNNM